MTEVQLWSKHLQLDTDPRVGFLKTAHIPRADVSYDLAFRPDPLVTYLGADEKQTLLRRFRRRCIMFLSLFVWLRSQVCLTIGQGSAIAMAIVPSKVTPSPKVRFLKWLLGVVYKKNRSLFSSKEALKRRTDYDAKLEAIIGDKIGDKSKLEGMMYVPLVMTAPESQGRGYASTLLARVTALADSMKLSAWLVSSNIANEPFYNKHGFKTVGTFTVGDDNPTWTKGPIVVQVMLREPKSKA